MKRSPFLCGMRFLPAGIAAVLIAMLVFAGQDEGPRFSAWGPATAIRAPIRADSGSEGCPFISKNDLDLYFRAWNKASWNGLPAAWSYDIFVSHRDSVDDPWEDPILLGPNINSEKGEMCSFVTIDGHWIYFVSGRAGTLGSTDIWVSHRENKRDDDGWEPPTNLGINVNSTAGEVGPVIFEDEATGQATLYFTKNVAGKNKIYSCVMLDKQIAAPAQPVAELNVAGANDLHAFVRRKDGLEVIFASDRGGISGMYDLYVSTRPTTMDVWSPPVKLGPEINSARAEARPSISWDGTTLYFWSDREWVSTGPSTGYYNMRIYKTTRTKILGNGVK